MCADPVNKYLKFYFGLERTNLLINTRGAIGIKLTSWEE
jgi:hypothetical protein